MKKIFTVALALLMAVFAQVALALDLDKMSNEQLAQLQAQAAQLQQARAKAPAETLASLATVDKVVEISRNIGVGLAATAKELGVAVNEFAESDVGRWVMIVLVWKYIGQDILGVATGLSMLVFGVGFGWFIVKRARVIQREATYTYVPVLFGLFSLKRVASFVESPDRTLTDSQQSQQLAGYLTMVSCFIAGLVILF